jgi:hypothetical protein
VEGIGELSKPVLEVLPVSVRGALRFLQTKKLRHRLRNFLCRYPGVGLLVQAAGVHEQGGVPNNPNALRKQGAGGFEGNPGFGEQRKGPAVAGGVLVGERGGVGLAGGQEADQASRFRFGIVQLGEGAEASLAGGMVGKQEREAFALFRPVLPINRHPDIALGDAEGNCSSVRNRPAHGP